jgi:hypothetical protein
MRWLAAFAMSVSLLTAQAVREPLRSVTAVRYWTLAGSARVAVTVSGDFAFRTARLHHPERVYFDILNSAPRFHAGSVYTETLEDPLLSRIHVAPNQVDVTRVVLDLAEGTDISTSRLVNPDRLMIELRPPGAGGDRKPCQDPRPAGASTTERGSADGGPAHRNPAPAQGSGNPGRRTSEDGPRAAAGRAG